MLHTALTLLRLKSAQNSCAGLNPIKQLSRQNSIGFSTNRRIHNARSKIVCNVKLRLLSTVDTAL
jgi:hypothetical protein